MKARVPGGQAKTISVSYNYDKNIVLSVGMIVKNEEKYLQGCLEGIKPLLDAVPSELVIVDTGSTDSTIETARKYTDKIYHFDWINDFSAARNFGLQKCRGAWFMFLDADDHFADVTDLIEFFSNEEINKNYHNGYYITRNYSTPQYDTYLEFRAHRIARRTDSLRFEGSIHESFVNFYNPPYYFSSYAYHYGYAFDTQEKLASKVKRNLDLLEKELEKDPDDLRTLNHYIDSYYIIDDKKRSLVERSIMLADKSESPSLYTSYLNAFEMYRIDKENEKALDVLEKAIKKANPDNAILGEVYGSKSFLLHKLERYAEAEESIYKYLEYYKKNQNNELDKIALGFVLSGYLIPEAHDSMKNTLASCLLKQNRAAEIISVYNDTDFSTITPDTYQKAIDIIADVCKSASARGGLAELYEKIAVLSDENKTSYFELKMGELYCADSTLARSFESANGNFAEFMRLCEAGNVSGIENFINRFDPLPEGYSQAFFLALKNNINLTGVLEKMNYELIRSHLTVIARSKITLPLIALKYQNEEFFFSSIKNLLFGVMLFEASISGAKSLKSEKKPEIYACFSKYASLYVRNVYNPGLLNESDIGALPETHRFGYYIAAAQNELEGGNKAEYIRTLKKALISCNSMKDAVGSLLEDFAGTRL